MNIASAVFECSSPDLGECPPGILPEFAFIGRSNVGKSTLLNAIVGRQGLARTSDIPGYTKLINFYRINNNWRLVDLPGYGFAQVARKDKAKFNNAVNDYIQNRENLAGVFVLIDSRHSPQKIDLDFVHWIGGTGVPLVLVFTKTDRVTPAHLHQNVESFKAAIADWFEELPEIFTCSSVARTGINDLLAAVEAVLEPA